jgi:hypothetical protein
MTSGKIITGLEVVRTKFKRILDSDADRILSAAKTAVVSTKKEHDKRLKQRRASYQPMPWGYSVSPGSPLRFRDAKVRDLTFRVDVVCKALWFGRRREPHSQQLAVRVWSLDKAVMFREALDAPEIEQAIDPKSGRVMLRFHFDQATSGQQAPRYHVQVGGRAQPEELCWLHEAVSVPRIAYPPIDLILACEMIAANFFPDEYKQIRSDPTWKGVLKTSQEYLLRDYFSTCMGVLDDDRMNISVLDELWSTPW